MSEAQTTPAPATAPAARKTWDDVKTSLSSTANTASDFMNGQFEKFKAEGGKILMKDGKPDLATFNKWVADKGTETANLFGTAAAMAKEEGKDLIDLATPYAEKVAGGIGEFAGNNKGALIGGGIALLGSMLMGGVNPIMMILMALAAAVIGSFMGGDNEKGGLFSGLANSMFGDKKDKENDTTTTEPEKGATKTIVISDPTTGIEATKISGLVKEGKLVISDMNINGTDGANHSIRLDNTIELKLDHAGKVDTADNLNDAKLAEILKRSAMIKGGDKNQDGNTTNDKDIAYADHGLSAAVNKVSATTRSQP